MFREITKLAPFVVASGATMQSGSWATRDNTLFYKGEQVALHGFSTTCPPYMIDHLARGWKTPCWANYNFEDPENVITDLNEEQAAALIGYLVQAKAPGVMPALRVPLNASSWLGVETAASAQALEWWPTLTDQYRTLIQKLVTRFTSEDIIVILDLHWNSDVEGQSEMARKGAEGVGDSVEFWHSIASTFKDNERVMYELYNEPHLTGDSADEIFLHGNDIYAGILDLIKAVRDHSQDQVMVIGGARDWAFDADSLIQLDALTDDPLIMYNFHMYMNPFRTNELKNVDGVQDQIQRIHESTDKPAIFTEFG